MLEGFRLNEEKIVSVIKKIWPYSGLSTRECIWFFNICSRFQGKFLNIGISSGSSVILMSEASPGSSIVAVDCFDKYLECNKNNDYSDKKESYLNHIKHFGIENRIENRFITSDDYFKTCNDKFDLAFVDGNHDYEFALRDIHNCWQRLNYGGVLLIHDFVAEDPTTCPRSEPGVTRAVWETFGNKVLDYEVHVSLLAVYKIHPAHEEYIRRLYLEQCQKEGTVP